MIGKCGEIVSSKSMFNDHGFKKILISFLCCPVVLWIGCGQVEEGKSLAIESESSEVVNNFDAANELSDSTEPEADQPAGETISQLKLFTVSGVVKSIETDLSGARIHHEEIPDYMKEMTMPFNIGDTNEWASIQPEDKISFLLHVTDDRSWIDGVEKVDTDVPSLDELSKTAPWRRVREVHPLEVGDLLPNYPMTNQLSKPITFEQYRGKALAITFIYTRCPLPDFCPKMNQQFLAAQQKLKTMEGAPDNWQFLSISFDPVNDTPERLKFYASAYQYDPEKWSFATGAMIEIDALTEQFGLMFYRAEGTVMDWDHNLRTILIDPEGKIQEIIVGNLWKTDELVEKIVTLANGGKLEVEDFE
jgi:protein SCO1/2